MAHGHVGNTGIITKNKEKEKKDATTKERRAELEEEVYMLQKMLEKEENVHHVLEHALHSQTTGMNNQIPSFLPKKAKEMLAELLMVEEEIARLESEVSQLQDELHATRETRVEDRKYDQLKRTSISLNEVLDQSLMTPSAPLEDKSMQEKLAMETRPLFFINQAMRGDYKIHGFTINGKTEKLVMRNNKTERQGLLHRQESIPRKSGIREKSKRNGTTERSSSPKLHLSNQSPMKQKNTVGITSTFLQESFPIPTSTERSYQKWQPNKLSEKIMKCLICIFLRLIRTSRVTELEKCGNLSKPGNLILRPGSFRVDNSLNLISKLNTYKEIERQDPYGVFEIEDSLTRDIGPYKHLVKFTSNSLDMKGLSISIPLLNQIRVLINNLHVVDLRSLSHQQKLAFWINMYNTCTMHGFLEHGLPSNPQKVDEVRSKALLNIGGNWFSAQAIEHFILRQPSIINKGDIDDKDDLIPNAYRLEHPEPNVLFALCRGSRSSPAVRIYTPDSISLELEKAKLEYLQASIGVTSTKKLKIPKLLLLSMHEFAQDLGSLLDWICHQLPASSSLRKSMSECLRGQNNEKMSEIVDMLPFDLEIQYLLPM